MLVPVAIYFIILEVTLTVGFFDEIFFELFSTGSNIWGIWHKMLKLGAVSLHESIRLKYL